MLITPEYAALNAELHQRVPAYGSGGHKWAEVVRGIVTDTGAKSVLDYGCGKGTLKPALRPIKVHEYDPAIPGKDVLPASAGVVVCTDVMEHVEPDCTDNVIWNLVWLATRAVFVVVSCKAGGKRLADGRPAHINVQSQAWWHERFSAVAPFEQLASGEDEYVALWVRHGNRR